jgi:protein TonB
VIDLPRGPVVELGGGFVFEAGDLDQPPREVVKTPPLYPLSARQREIEGYVQVRFLVDERGRVSELSVLDSSPRRIFEDSVLRAVPGWRFEPGRIDGRPVSSWVVTTIRFEMEE